MAAMARPASAEMPRPGDTRRTRASSRYPPSDAATTSSQTTESPPPYPRGTVCAFQMPDSMSRLPRRPNGVSARAAKASTPRGSVCTGTANAGISHGRLSSAAHAATVARRRTRSPPLPRHSAAGTAAIPVTAMAANPPIAAGARTHSSRVGLVRTGPVLKSRSTHGSPA